MASQSEIDGAQRTFWIETLGCPKNQVDSDKLTGKLLADGLEPALDASDADVVVVNTCAFVEDARTESVDTILALGDVRQEGSELIVTGCMAERYGSELAEALPEADRIAPFGAELLTDTGILTSAPGTPVSLGPTRRVPDFDLLNLARPASTSPWAYVKIAEGCDRACGFCAIPSFRGKQRSRSIESIVTEVQQLKASEIVLVAQDLAAYGRDQGQGQRSIIPLIEAVREHTSWVRLLYLYPSDLTDGLIETILATEVPYFDLSLQHVSRPLLKRMRRWGSGEQFLSRMEAIRAREQHAAFRSNFIVGYPGETEDDHDELLRFVEQARLNWCGFFSYSAEDGTYATTLDGEVPASLVDERLFELRDLQDQITTELQDETIDRSVRVLVDAPGIARSYREAPEIDGIINVPEDMTVGTFADVTIVDAAGPDLVGVPK